MPPRGVQIRSCGQCKYSVWSLPQARGVMLQGAVIPLPYFRSRWKDAVVGLLLGGGCVCTRCFPTWGFGCCGLDCAHRLVLVPCFWDSPLMGKALKALTGEMTTDRPIASLEDTGHRCTVSIQNPAQAARCPQHQCVTKHLGQAEMPQPIKMPGCGCPTCWMAQSGAELVREDPSMTLQWGRAAREDQVTA